MEGLILRTSRPRAKGGLAGFAALAGSGTNGWSAVAPRPRHPGPWVAGMGAMAVSGKPMEPENENLPDFFIFVTDAGQRVA
jgi:hypothetical protein